MKKTDRTKTWIIYTASFILIGIIIGVIAALISTETDKRDAKKQMLAVSQYVKQQCIRYEELAAEDASRSLYDVSDKAFSIRSTSSIDYSAPLDDQIKSHVESNRLSGILVTETTTDGKSNVVAYYSDGEESADMWSEYIAAFSSVSEDLYKSYSERLLVNGYYYDYTMVARGDCNGALLCYKRQRVEDVEDDRFSVATLLKGFVSGSDGIVVVTDGNVVLASNEQGKVGNLAENTEVVRVFRQQEVFDSLTRVVDDEAYYGVRTKCKNLYIYAYMSDGNVFARRSMVLSMVYSLYLCAVVAIIVGRRIIVNRKHEEQERIEETYRAEKERLAQQAIKANEAKTEFLRRMSHDIRTPINGIRGMVKIGDYYSDDPEKQKECREKIMNASDYLLELVNDILYMNKLSTDEPDWKDEKFRLSDLLASVNAFMGTQAKEAGLSFAVETQTIEHDYLFGGKLQLQRVFTNLVGNAIKYNKPNGSVIVSTRETGFKDGYAHFVFRCKDTGIGMDEEFMKKMYEPFERENRADGKSLDGVGLGLSIVKKLVTRGGWTLNVESKKDEGTVFTLEADFKVVEEFDKPSDIPVADEAEKLKGFNILVAEDNELNYEIVRFMLEVAGAKITRACNGKEAVEAFKRSRENEYDVILMDVMMPETDGLEATRIIRRIDRADAKTVPIVAMTASTFADDVSAAAAAGMNAHIPKPIDGDKLIDCILRLKYAGGGTIMNVKKIYDALGEDYGAVADRLGSEEMLARFVGKFLSDDSFAQLEKAMAAADVSTAFRAAHTLKGIAQNLGFTTLGRSASELTEVLRAKTFEGTAELFERVKADYAAVVRAIGSF